MITTSHDETLLQFLPAQPGWRARYDHDALPYPVAAWAVLQAIGRPAEQIMRVVGMVAIPGQPHLVPADKAGAFTGYLPPDRTAPAEDAAAEARLNDALNRTVEQGLL